LVSPRFDRELERAWELEEQGRLDQAARLGERLLRTYPEEPEVLLLLASCARDRGDVEGALALLERATLVEPEWYVPELWAAELLAKQPGRLAEARRRCEALVRRHPEEAAAWYGLGSVCEALEDEKGKRAAWLQVLRLDAAEPETAEWLSEAEVAAVAEQALMELPDRARRLLAEVPILIADLPARADVAAGLDPRLLGLFVGTPYPELFSVGGAAELTQIVLFRRNLERVADDEENLREEIRTTLLHETGHFFGMSESDLDAVGLG
jgi:predicted Zn-dependent protease with MMP-like domain